MFFVQVALADPCIFTGPTEETELVEGLGYAVDNDKDTWTRGTNLYLGAVLEENQQVESVGVLVQTEEEITFDLDIWYLPEGETEDVELLSLNGELPEGENRGRWNTAILAEELLYSLNTSSLDPVGFQVLCESSEYLESRARGGGGCTGCHVGQKGSFGTILLPLMVCLLRRRK